LLRLAVSNTFLQSAEEYIMSKIFRHTWVIVATLILVVITLLMTNNLAHTTEVALEPLDSATAREINSLKQVNLFSQNLERESPVTSIQQIPDVSQKDYYYEALSSIIERYGVDVTFQDRTFKGNQPLTRGDFIVYLNDALVQVERLMSTSHADVGNVSILINELVDERRSLDTELTQIKKRLDELERKLAKR
jgi:hypothetical protein